jgi:hypothetical protein
MKCSFCNRDENEIIGIFAPIIMNFEKEISELNTIIEDTKEKYSIKHGFVKENFEKVNTIDKNILDIKLDAILNNFEPFLKIDQNIGLLISYFNNYKPQITSESTLKDLLDLFIKEPTEKRLSDEVEKIVLKRDSLAKNINVIKEKNKFGEIENINDIIIPLKVFNFEKELESDIVKIARGSSLKRKISLCPYCSVLINPTEHKKEKNNDNKNTNYNNNDWSDNYRDEPQTGFI